MSDLDALLEGIIANPTDALRWLVMADWLEDHGQPERAELVRVHRELLRTCTATRETKARKQLHARMMELMRAGVQPCLPRRTITLPGGVEMRFSFIPPGSFLMGSLKSEAGRGQDERRHLVTLTKGFWMGQTPVTQRQWIAVMGNNPSNFKGDELPVESVRWADCQECCAALRARTGYAVRLPTEAEWECAARAGTTTPFYWGTELSGMQANCDGKCPCGTDKKGAYLERTTTVGHYARKSPHPWGLVDMLGNVLEWCSSLDRTYSKQEVEDVEGQTTAFPGYTGVAVGFNPRKVAARRTATGSHRGTETISLASALPPTYPHSHESPSAIRTLSACLPPPTPRLPCSSSTPTSTSA